MPCANGCFAKIRTKRTITVLVFSLLFAASPTVAEPLQRFRCDAGSLFREIEIHEDSTRKEGRRLFIMYKGGDLGDHFAMRVKHTGYVAYVEDNNRDEMRYYPDTGRLEFWDNYGKISANSVGDCWSYGPERKAKEKVQTPKIQHFSCTGSMSVELVNISPGWVKLKKVYADGKTSSELLQIIDGFGYVKLQTKSSQKHEKDEMQRWGAGFTCNHLKYFPERNQLQFWSDGGGKMGPAKMYTTCGSN